MTPESTRRRASGTNRRRTERRGAPGRLPGGGLVALFLLLSGCSSREPTLLVPEQGYAWPSAEREYWPTDGWRTGPPDALDPEGLARADAFARDDPLARSLLVVEGGYLVFEEYYGDGGPDRSANLWSVTKSFTSALVGLLFTDGLLDSVHAPMAAAVPAYPALGELTVHHVLTHTSGLRWTEEGLPWVEWVSSPDWIAAALARGREHEPGRVFRYSSANSQFLCELIRSVAGVTPGELAELGLFRPLGIPFQRQEEIRHYESWDAYRAPLDHSWRQDPTGLETGGFCLYLTPRDLAKLGFLYLNRGTWDGVEVLSPGWVEASTRDQVTDVYGRYSYGYHWWITLVDGVPCFLASGLGGQIIGVVPSLDLVLVITYEAEEPVDPVSGTAHDDMRLFELVVQAVRR
jgi:CubicO group peptidase (beta-lactamase class C family)